MFFCAGILIRIDQGIRLVLGDGISIHLVGKRLFMKVVCDLLFNLQGWLEAAGRKGP